MRMPLDSLHLHDGSLEIENEDMYLTLEEAAEYSGLSYEYLVQLVQEQKVTAIEDGGWKIRRADLESL